jgi:hypothetical protein
MASTNCSLGFPSSQEDYFHMEPDKDLSIEAAEAETVNSVLVLVSPNLTGILVRPWLAPLVIVPSRIVLVPYL